ncbi:MAG: fumarylacetoacetate hydrolase family protein [Bacteroidaceae bacterium]|nr:fumarylacetoacetate hydrolase family protein [Bacteroidaceae bacterium]
MQACPRIWLKADSALLTHGKPMFKPDFTRELSAAPYLALRISRMGKSIPARFAHRYYDAVGVAVDFTAEDVLRQLRSEGEPWDMAKSFDGSVCLGEWLELGVRSEELGVNEVKLTLLVDGTEQSTLPISDLKAEAGEIIEQVSGLFTLRQGDILLMGKPERKPLVEIDNHIEGMINGRLLTKFNVK